MLATIEYTKGLGDTALAVKLIDPATKDFWNFVSQSWGALGADCFLLMAEQPSDADDAEAVYAASLTPPAGGPFIQMAVLMADGTMLASDITAEETIVTLTDEQIAAIGNSVSNAGVFVTPTVLPSLLAVANGETQEYYRGDCKPLTFTLGAQWSLTGKHAWFCAKRNSAKANTTAIINRRMTVLDAGTGSVTITPTSTESGTVGIYDAEIEIRDSSDSVNSAQTALRFTLKILQDTRQ